MPVPKRKRSRARRDSRFANKGLKVKVIAACSQCKAAILPHQVCKECGFYKGAKVLKTKADRIVKRVELKQAKAQATEQTQSSQE